MTINVYAWPPVYAVGTEWTEVAPVEVSRSIITGAEYISAAQRKRRHVSLTVGCWGRNGDGAGYMEVLKRLLEGIHAVRLYSCPINARRNAVAGMERQSAPIDWTSGGSALSWTSGGSALAWYSGTVLSGTTGTDGAGFPIITVSGLPASRLVALPGEFITAYADADDVTGATVQVMAPATSDASGIAAIRLVEALPAGTDVRVNIGTRDTAVFRPVGYPRSERPMAGEWTYSWQFREVFADEVGGFTEVDPWR